jgi:uncharacterized membrane protein YfcA
VWIIYRDSILPGLFVFIACCGIGFGLLCLPTALFVGPHVLAVSFSNVLAGAASLIIARGLRRRAVWAWWSGLSLCFAIIAVTVFGLAQSVSGREVANSVFFAVVGIFVFGVFVALLLLRGNSKSQGR